MIVHDGNLPEVVADDRDTGRPEHGTDCRPREEAPTRHLPHSCDDGDEGAHDRNEPADDERLVAVLVEEIDRLVEVFALEEPRSEERRVGKEGRSRGWPDE